MRHIHSLFQPEAVDAMFQDIQNKYIPVFNENAVNVPEGALRESGCYRNVRKIYFIVSDSFKLFVVLLNCSTYFVEVIIQYHPRRCIV